ncbi:MAG TPA: NHL repeat-containing protein, partial [bacterium]|nr:NHL repeat-containing protein [bacterium]
LCPPGPLWADVQILTGVPSTYMFPAEGFTPLDLHRGTQTLLSLMLPGTTFDDPQGMACALLKRDHDPQAPLNDVVVTVLGVNSGAGEVLYNVGLKDLKRYGSPGGGVGQFRGPTGAALNSDGSAAIADTGNDRVVLLHDDGLRLRWVGTVPGTFHAPQGVAYDTAGDLFIADTGADRVLVRPPHGAVRVLPLQGLDHPTALAVIDSKADWTFYKTGPLADRLAVIDRMGARLSTYTLAGAPLAQFTSDQAPDGPMRLWGCAFDYYGNLVATDTAAGCLRKFGRNLEYLATFGSPGVGDYQFDHPRGICLNTQFGQMFVANRQSADYYWVGADARDLAFQRTPQGFRFPFFLTERALVTAKVLDGQGAPVKDLGAGMDLEEGAQELDWDPDPSLPAGTYTLRLTVMATYSTREREAKRLELSVPYSK